MKYVDAAGVVRVYLYTCMNTYAHVCMYACMHTCIHTWSVSVHVHMCICVCACMYIVCMHECVCMYAYTCMYVCVCMCMCMHAHCMHAYTCVRACICMICPKHGSKNRDISHEKKNRIKEVIRCTIAQGPVKNMHTRNICGSMWVWSMLCALPIIWVRCTLKRN